jgi:hypothetical protein
VRFLKGKENFLNSVREGFCAARGGEEGVVEAAVMRGGGGFEGYKRRALAWTMRSLEGEGGCDAIRSQAASHCLKDLLILIKVC